MHPNVFVSKDFFKILDEEVKNLSTEFLYEEDEKKTSFQRIFSFINSSNIYTDLRDKEIVKYYKKSGLIKEGIESVIIQKIIKNYGEGRSLNLNKTIKDCKTCDFTFFTADEYNDCEKHTLTQGKIYVGKKPLDFNFFHLTTFTYPLVDITSYDYVINNLKHPCNCIVVIDPYIFTDAKNHHNKIPNFIKYLKGLIPKDLQTDFEIDIITKNVENNSLFNSKFNEIIKELEDYKVSLHVYAPKKLDIPDRYLLTNYATITIGHPFDRDTHISSCFYPSNYSKELNKIYYNSWYKMLKKAHEVIRETPQKFGLIEAIWKNDDKKHSIFDVIQTSNSSID